MKANELMIGDWVYNRVADITFQVYPQFFSQWHNKPEQFEDIIQPISLTTKILEKNGWIEASGYWVLKGHSTRLGWKDGEMIVGYSALPEKIFYVHELQNLMKAVKISCNFEI